MEGLTNIFSNCLIGFFALLVSNTVILLATFICGKKEQKPQTGDDRMPKSITGGTPSAMKTAMTPTEMTPSTSINMKESQASQVSNGMNWSNMKVNSKEEAEKTNLDEIPEEQNIFVNKRAQPKVNSGGKEEGKMEQKGNKSKKSNSKKKYKKDKKMAFHGNLQKKPAVATPIATPSPAPHKEKRCDGVTQTTTMKTVDTGGHTQCTMMRTVDEAGCTQGTIMRTVDQTMDCASMYKETPRSPPPAKDKSKISMMREINVEPSSNDQKPTQETLPSHLQPTQMLPPKPPSVRKEVQNGAKLSREKIVASKKKEGSRESLKNAQNGAIKSTKRKQETQGTEEESTEERPNSEAGQSRYSTTATNTTASPSEGTTKNNSRKMDGAFSIYMK